MNQNRKFSKSFALLLAALFCAGTSVLPRAADAPNPAPSKSKRVGDGLFEDKLVAKGKGVEIHESDIEDSFLAFKASKAAVGQQVPIAMQKEVEAQILEKLIATQLFLSQATDKDREVAKGIADKFIQETKAKMPSEAAYKRQLLAEGTSSEQFESQILEQAVVKAVIDRLIKIHLTLTDEEVKKFYDENPAKFEIPERLKAAHILIATKSPTGEEMPPEEKAEKRKLAERVLERAKKGEDFGKLVNEFSQDRKTRSTGGEYTFPRGQMPETFEAAAFSMKPGQISEIVTTAFGYHIIKLLEVIPGKKETFEETKDKIREALLQDQVQKKLPDQIEKLKKEANVELVKN